MFSEGWFLRYACTDSCVTRTSTLGGITRDFSVTTIATEMD